jgi:arylsulfatase A-like enzyme
MAHIPRLIILLALAICMPTAARAATSPNILFIMVDDLGWGDLSSYGATDLKTPNIDHLISEGMRFDNFRANSCVCSPTRAAFLTGRYQDLVGVPGVIRTPDKSNFGYLDPEAVTIADVFKNAGYHTALIGKWHLGLKSPNLPNDRGFDYFHGWQADMMDDYYKHHRYGRKYMYRNEEQINPEGHATDLFTAWASAYLESRKEEEAPFFLFLSYNAPHTPIQPPADWLAKVKEREPEISNKRAGLVALIEHLDNGIGKVLDVLDKQGLKDNTIIVFTSDNGGQLAVGATNGPVRGGKTMMYEGGLKVATCVSWPGHITAGSRTDFQAMTMDFLPTLCEATGTAKPAVLDGQSFLPTLLGNKQQAFDRLEFHTWLQHGRKEAMRNGDWKLVCDVPGQAFELYNLKDDPKETTNLAETHPEKYTDMMKLMKGYQDRAHAVNWLRPGQTSPDSVK